MLLAEVLIERDYVNESIRNLSNIIENLLIVYDESNKEINKKRLKELFKKLEDLYKKCQQLDIVINRAQAFATITINETEVSLKDAMIIRDVMGNRLKCFVNFLDIVIRKKSDKVINDDIDNIVEIIDTLKIDIKTLNTKIQGKIWNIEVK